MQYYRIFTNSSASVWKWLLHQLFSRFFFHIITPINYSISSPNGFLKVHYVQNTYGESKKEKSDLWSKKHLPPNPLWHFGCKMAQRGTQEPIFFMHNCSNQNQSHLCFLQIFMMTRSCSMTVKSPWWTCESLHYTHLFGILGMETYRYLW